MNNNIINKKNNHESLVGARSNSMICDDRYMYSNPYMYGEDIDGTDPKKIMKVCELKEQVQILKDIICKSEMELGRILIDKKVPMYIIRAILNLDNNTKTIDEEITSLNKQIDALRDVSGMSMSGLTPYDVYIMELVMNRAKVAWEDDIIKNTRNVISQDINDPLNKSERHMLVRMQKNSPNEMMFYKFYEMDSCGNKIMVEEI